MGNTGSSLQRKSNSFFLINKYDPSINSNTVSHADIHHWNQLLNMVEKHGMDPIQDKFFFICNFGPKIFH